MSTVTSTIAKCSAAILLGMSLAVLPVSAADDDPLKSLELKLEGDCDKANRRLWVISSHDSKTILATLRWNLAGSKRVVTEQFSVAPAARLEIGCAAQADIVVAAFIAP